MSEFGHPEVAIVLTCLSYYYEGLQKDHLRQSFELLVRDPSANEQFANWCAASDLGISSRFESLHAINLGES